MEKTWKTIVVTAIVTLFASQAFAGFFDNIDKKLDNVEKVLKNDKQASGKEEVKSADVLAAFVISAASITQAQALQLEAFGKKEQARELSIITKSLGSNKEASEDDIKKIISTSKRANKIIQKEMDAGTKLTAEGRKLYLKSLLPFSTGLVGLRYVVNNASALEDDVKSGSWTKKLVGGSASIYLARKAPGYFTRLYKTSSLMMIYARNNGMKVPRDAEQKLGELG